MIDSSVDPDDLSGEQEEKMDLISFHSKCFVTWNQFNVSQTKDDSPTDKPNAFSCSTKARYVIAQTMLRVWSASGRRGPESVDWSHLACWVMSRPHTQHWAGTVAYSFKWLHNKMTFNNERWMHSSLVDSFCFMFHDCFWICIMCLTALSA